MSKAIRTYFRPRQQDVSQGQMLVELYDGALQYLHQARDQMVAQRYPTRKHLINLAIDIIEELAKSLDTRSGGDLAVKLNNLYLLCASRLLRANQRLCIDDIDSVVAILRRLRAAYALFPGVDKKNVAASQKPIVENDN